MSELPCGVVIRRFPPERIPVVVLVVEMGDDGWSWLPVPADPGDRFAGERATDGYGGDLSAGVEQRRMEWVNRQFVSQV
ncbi:hypothetical protein [Amycolatopsis aidingensis]|uniref:hypothetical protein n=1 Tax=Amycolatopsis aidingensis TaxID=2842453 RepID=UPI001C0CD3F7|nr:hypothetical protein [Amycolatopsis aidingensis]